MKTEKLTCERDNLTIRGIICRSEVETEKSPVIILSHGFTCNMYSCMGYCESLCQAGFVCVLYSFCGGGNKMDSEEVKSDGNSVDMTISSEVADLKTIIEYVKSLNYVDAKRIMLLGESQGGFVSGLTAAALPAEINRLIMIFPALCIPDHARQGCLGFAHYDPQNMPDSIDIGVTVIGKKLHEDVVEMDPYAEIVKYKGPVLIIHGDADPIVDCSYSVKAESAYGKEQCTLHIISQMGHGVDENHRDMVLTYIHQFLAQ